MIKAKFIGNQNLKSYKTKEFHASRNNIVFMSDETWSMIEKKGDAKLFEKVDSLAKKFPSQKTISPGI